MRTGEIPFDDVGNEISKYYPLKAMRMRFFLICPEGEFGSAQFLLLNIVKELLKNMLKWLFSKNNLTYCDSYKYYLGII